MSESQSIRSAPADQSLVQREAYNARRDSLSYPPIPDAELFQHRYGHEKPAEIIGWAWSDTFGRWSALVVFADGWRGYTYPKC